MRDPKAAQGRRSVWLRGFQFGFHARRSNTRLSRPDGRRGRELGSFSDRRRSPPPGGTQGRQAAAGLGGDEGFQTPRGALGPPRDPARHRAARGGEGLVIGQGRPLRRARARSPSAVRAKAPSSSAARRAASRSRALRPAAPRRRAFSSSCEPPGEIKSQAAQLADKLAFDRDRTVARHARRSSR